MIIERTKNTKRNIMAGSLLKGFQILLPFLMRTAVIYFMGIQYLGLNSLFTSILQVLNMAELGINSAMVFSMYKPITEDDTETLCALIKLYRTYYRIIGLVIGVVGVLLLPFVPYLINGEIPGELNIYILYLLNLAATVLSYWLFAYKNSILTAHQRNDVSSIVMLITTTLQYGLQIIIVIFLKNYYLYVIAVLGTQVLNNVLTAAVATKMYPDYKPIGKLDKSIRYDINSRIKDLFVSKVGGVILGSVDTIVISAFLGLTVLAIYQNYFFIISAIYGFVEIILTSIIAGMGNSLIVETKEKNYRDVQKITFMFSWLIGFCMCCFVGIFQPFMKIWVGEELLLPYGVVISFCIYFYAYEFTRLFNVFKSAAGEWHKDRFRPLISSIVNLCLNLLMVKPFGVYGVIWSTIIALSIVEIPWLLQNLFSVIYEHVLLKKYLKTLGTYFSGTLVAWIVTAILTRFVFLGEWTTFFICMLISCLVPNVMFYLLYRNLGEFKDSIRLVDKMTKGKLNLKKALLKEE